MSKTQKHIIGLFLGLICSTQGISQEYGDVEYYLIDSLDLSIIQDDDLALIHSSLEEYHAAKSDTSRINAIAKIVEDSWDENVWPRYNDWLYEFTRKRLYYKNPPEVEKELRESFGSAVGNKGYYARSKGNTLEALEWYELGLKIDIENGDTVSMAKSYNNIGFIYRFQGNTPLALDYYHKSLSMKEQVGDYEGMAVTYNNIGALHEDQGDTATAFDFYRKSLALDRKYENHNGIAISLNNFGVSYSNQGDYLKALEFYRESFDNYKSINDRDGMAKSYNNMGTAYRNLDELDSAQLCHERSLNIYLNSGDKKGIGTSNYLLGVLEYESGNYSKAKRYGEISLQYAQEIGYPYRIQESANLLRKSYVIEGNWNAAYKMYELEIEMRDSLVNIAYQRETFQQQTQFEFEQKQAKNDKEQALKDAAYENEIAIREERKQKQETISYFAFGGLILLIAFLLFVFNRLKITRRQKNEIDVQKQELQATHEQLEEHHKEISDSINYAKRIQEAIMPSMASMKTHMEKGFVIYLPKDVVAGDFYWMEPIDNTIYFAAADCTGHGVPGAMVSVVCSNGLNKALLEEGIRDTGKLLDRTRELVIDRLGKSGEEVKDGMDISLCAFNKDTLELQWSGANNPLWIIRDGELKETKADKQPIGKYDAASPFTTHNIQLQVNDLIYVFTDGLQDQFGGPKGKKLKTRFLKELLKKHHADEMNAQQKILEKAFHNWKGDLEQVDDVCMIGIRV